MFSVESAKKQIQKNSIENSILETKVEFWNKLVNEDGNGNFGYTDRIAEYIVDGVVKYPSGCLTCEKETIDFYLQKIESLETQLYAIA